MARKNSRVGVCSICGSTGKLSYEHIPPSSAFNNCGVLETDIHKMIGGDLVENLSNPSGTINQRGAGGFTICSNCNNETGSWYGAAYVNFVRALYHIPNQLNHEQVASVQVECQPQNILKQIMTMFCSACGPSFSEKHPSIRRYLLNKSETALDPSVSIFLSFFDFRNSRSSRQSGITGRVSLDGDNAIYSEISFPPFNIIMSLNSKPPDKRLFEITWFKRFQYSERTSVNLKLTNLAVNSYFPGDYRTFDELASLNKGQA